MSYGPGSSVSGKTPISKTGHSEIRKARYMPAIVCSCGRMKDGISGTFTRRLKAGGKTDMEIRQAVRPCFT